MFPNEINTFLTGHSPASSEESALTTTLQQMMFGANLMKSIEKISVDEKNPGTNKSVPQRMKNRLQGCQSQVVCREGFLFLPCNN